MGGGERYSACRNKDISGDTHVDDYWNGTYLGSTQL
jgi:hypothetical protein